MSIRYLGGILKPGFDPLTSRSGIFNLHQHYSSRTQAKWINTDPYFSNVSLYLKGNGVNNSTTFSDNSANNLNLGLVGTPIISTTQSKFGGSSMYFNGTSQYLSVPSTDFSSFAFGTGDFTIEFWSYLQSAVTEYQFLININHANGNLDVRYGNSGFGNKLQVGVNTNTLATTWSCALTKAGDVGAWKHIAFTRSGTTCRLFVNGTVQNINSGSNPSTYPVSSFTSSVDVANIISVSIGGNSTHVSSEYLDDLRITKGVARYTATFTAPTSELEAW